MHKWLLFSKGEFKNTIIKCNDSSTSRPDCTLWKHLKAIIKDNKCFTNIINIANMCLDLGLWPAYFKTLSSIIIPKAN